MSTPDPEPEPDLDALRVAFARGGGRGGEPVDPEELWAVVCGEADPRAAAPLVERLARDAALLEEWTVARVFAEEAAAAEARDPAPAEEAAAAEPGAPAANASAYRSWLALAAVAAAVLVAVLLWPRAQPVRYDGGSGEMRTSTAAALRSTVEGPLRRDAATLTWTAVEGATRYEVQVTTVDLEPVLAVTGLAQPSVTLDAARLVALPPGTTLLWRVEAVLGDGSRERSETFTIALESP